MELTYKEAQDAIDRGEPVQYQNCYFGADPTWRNCRRAVDNPFKYKYRLKFPPLKKSTSEAAHND
jgi:hypothetical protein